MIQKYRCEHPLLRRAYTRHAYRLFRDTRLFASKEEKPQTSDDVDLKSYFYVWINSSHSHGVCFRVFPFTVRMCFMSWYCQLI